MVYLRPSTRPSTKPVVKEQFIWSRKELPISGKTSKCVGMGSKRYTVYLHFQINQIMIKAMSLLINLLEETDSNNDMKPFIKLPFTLST